MRIKLDVISTLTLLGSALMVVNGALIIHANGPIVVSTEVASNLESAWPNAPKPSDKIWGRIMFGLPRYSEGQIAYIWLFFALLSILLSLLLCFLPKRHKILALLQLAAALCTIPIGGGFIFGLILAIIGCCLTLEYPTEFKETFIGTLILALGVSKKFLKKAEASMKAKKAVSIVITVAVLSSIGISLYVINVSRIYPQPVTSLAAEAFPGDVKISVVNATGFKNGIFVAIGKHEQREVIQVKNVDVNLLELTVALQYRHGRGEIVTALTNSFDVIAASEILIHGNIYLDVNALTLNILSSIIIGVLKWLTLSVIAYILCIKMHSFNIPFEKLAIYMSLVYVPEVLYLFLPIAFWNEPMLSKGWFIGPLPFSWPLLLFYGTHILSFIVVVNAIDILTELEKIKVIGLALASCSIYFLVTYLIVPQFIQQPGIRIAFTEESHLFILGLASIAFVIAWLLNAFKKT